MTRDNLALPAFEFDASSMLPAWACGDRSLDPRPDLSLFTVEKDPEHICAPHSVDVTVTQVDAEQVRVCGVLVLVEGFEPPLDRF